MREYSCINFWRILWQEKFRYRIKIVGTDRFGAVYSATHTHMIHEICCFKLVQQSVDGATGIPNRTDNDGVCSNLVAYWLVVSLLFI